MNAASNVVWTFAVDAVSSSTATASINDGTPQVLGACTNFTPLAGPYIGAMRPIDPVDDDGDGIPDAWEREHFGRPLAADAGPDLDPDADGVLNRDEYTAGTDPLDGAEYFRMQMSRLGEDRAVVVFETVTAAGGGYAGQRRRYALEHAPTPGGAWEPVSGFTDLPGEGADVWFAPGSNALPFYRGRVWLEPED